MKWWINTIFIGGLVVFIVWVVIKSWQARSDTPRPHGSDIFDDPNVG